MRKFYNLFIFDGEPINSTTSADLSATMKEFYNKNLIKKVGPYLVHDQFAQQEDIPNNNGKTQEFRGFQPLPKALTPLTEGVTPEGTVLKMFTKTVALKQYGAYVPLTDVLMLTALDPMILNAQDALSQQAGATLDTVTREVINAGTNVQYAEGTKDSRSALTGSDLLTVKAIKKAVKTLKKRNTPKINGNYCVIIHPDVSFDLTEDPEYKEQVKYTDSSSFKNGFLYRQWGCEFYESTEAKIWANAGASSQDVYSTLVVGDKAYAITKLTGGRSIETIVHQKGSAGSADPLDQRATVGWKAMKAAVILIDEYMVRIETGSTTNDHEEN